MHKVYDQFVTIHDKTQDEISVKFQFLNFRF